ncbi:MAG: TonB-dependent receptor [Cytophagales bacterium]
MNKVYLSCMLLMVATHVFSQEQILTENNKNEKDSVSHTVLEEVVISDKKTTVSDGLRVTTPIQELPQNIQIIGKETLKSQQSFDMLEGIQRNVSGVQRVEHWDNYAQIMMRGSQITAFRNGFNVAMPFGPLSEDMSMVEKIEFVKGPAGFMLSNGEPAGFYNVVTKKPTGKEKGEIAMTVGSFETYRTTVDLDGKLSKNGKLLYRLNLMGQLKGSHRKYEYNNRYSIVPVLKYLIDDKTSVTLEYTQQFSQMNVIGSNYIFSKKKYDYIPVDFTTAEPNLLPTNINDKSVIGILEHKINNNWKLTTQLGYFNYNQVGQSLWPSGFVTGSDSKIQRGMSVWDALGINKTGQVFVNGNVNTGSIHHKILSGLDMGTKDYYADWNQGAALGDTTFDIYNPVYGTVSAQNLPTWDRSKNIKERGVRYVNNYSSLYIQDELGFLNDQLRLTLAGRYTTNANINPYSGTANDKKFTPRVGLSYSIDKNTNTYAVYDQAFLPNYGADYKGKSFDPVTGNNLEWGLKKDWFNRKFNTTFSVYQITKNNVLTTDLEHPNENTGQFTYMRETGQQKARGVEVDLRGEIVKNVEIVANYAYTDTKVTKDSDPKIVGTATAGATKHIQNTWITYKSKKGLGAAVGYQYQKGRSSWYITTDPDRSLPDYFRLDGNISYQSKKLDVIANVNNILNAYLFSGGPYYGIYYWQAEPLRNYRLTIAYKF